MRLIRGKESGGRQSQIDIPDQTTDIVQLDRHKSDKCECVLSLDHAQIIRPTLMQRFLYGYDRATS